MTTAEGAPPPVGSQAERRAATWSERGALAVAGGLLMGAPFALRALWPLGWIAGVPWLLLIAHPRWRGPGQVRLGWLLLASEAFLFVSFTLALAPAGWTAAVLGALLYVPFPFLALVLVREVRRRRDVPLVLLWPAAWTTCEWAWSRLGVGAIEFAQLAFGQAAFPVILQVADLVGSFGLSALVAAGSGAVADIWIARAAADPRTRRTARLGAAALAALVAAALAYGVVRPRTLVVEPGPRVALFQPNLPRGEAVTHESFLRALAYVADEVEPGDVDLAALPENSLEDFLERPENLADAVEIQRRTKTPLVLGAFGVHPDFRGQEQAARAIGLWPFTNAAFMLGGDGRIVASGHKVHLLPFSEYMPAGELLADVSPALAEAEKDLARWALGFGGTARPGAGVQIFPVEARGRTYRAWVPICFEISDSRLARDAAKLGADFVLNVTSEGRLGPQMFWSMVSIAQVRAVEMRRAVARSANTGITCVIGPDGRLHEILEVDGQAHGVAGVLRAEIPVASGGPTLAARLGDAVPATLAGVSAALLIAAFVRPGSAAPSGASS